MVQAITENIALLRRIPEVLPALLTGLPEAWLRAPGADGLWSAVDVVAHLAHAEETLWITRARVILEGGAQARFTPFEPEGFRAWSAGLGSFAVLERFRAGRARSLDALDGLALGPAQLGRVAQHPDLGPVTLAQLLSTWAVHDLNHLGQIVACLAHVHADAVGPWKRYLGILQRP